MSAKRKRVIRYTDSAMGIDAMVDYYCRMNNLDSVTFDTLESLRDRPSTVIGKEYKIILTIEEV